MLINMTGGHASDLQDTHLDMWKWLLIMQDIDGEQALSYAVSAITE